MFWKRKVDPSPLGVRLGDLAALLAATSIRSSFTANGLVARHEDHTVNVDVVPPETRETQDGPIRAVVRITTDVPKPFPEMLRGREAKVAAALNGFAALGALYLDGNTVRIGSRLTIFEAEDAWRTLHLPLLLSTAIGSAEGLLGGFRHALTGRAPAAGASRWAERDFDDMRQGLSRFCVCTGGGLGLSAEFGLSAGSVAAAVGDQDTALFQLRGDQPHPGLGGGLFCLLQMPHRLGDTERVPEMCLRLNGLEMAAQDLPPHFGAWCPGRLGDNLAYVSFLPNALHEVKGIGMNVAVWAMARANWASQVIESHCGSSL